MFVRYLRISLIELQAEYGNTKLGIGWVPITSLIFSAALAFIFRPSNSMQVSEFFLYVFCGYVLWLFISDTVTDSTKILQKKYEFAIHNGMSLFGLYAKLLLDRSLPYFINVMTLIVIISFVAPSNFSWTLVLFVPFIAMILLTALFGSYIVNLATVIFPDLASPIRLGTRFMFFVSPIFWTAADHNSGVRFVLNAYNPVAYYLSAARQVFGVQQFDMFTWLIAALLTTVISLGGSVLFLKTQNFAKSLQ